LWLCERNKAGFWDDEHGDAGHVATWRYGCHTALGEPGEHELTSAAAQHLPQDENPPRALRGRPVLYCAVANEKAV
jgi:hypothetical protein